MAQSDRSMAADALDDALVEDAPRLAAEIAEADRRSLREAGLAELIGRDSGALVRRLDELWCHRAIDDGRSVGAWEAVKLLLPPSHFDALREAIKARHYASRNWRGEDTCHHDRPFPEWASDVPLDHLEVKAERAALRAAWRAALRQSDEWVDGEGRCWKLTEMDPRHRRAVQRFVRRRARGYAMARSWDIALFPFSGDAAQDAQEQLSEAMLDVACGSDEQVEEWVNGTPLVRRLVKLDGVVL